MFTICNGYPAHVWVAIMFYSPDVNFFGTLIKGCGGEGMDFETRGWWSIAPGRCVNVHADDLEDRNRYWYYYAEAADGAVWAGPYKVLVSNEAFDLCYGYVSSEHGHRYIEMRELDIDDNDDYTLTLVP